MRQDGLFGRRLLEHFDRFRIPILFECHVRIRLHEPGFPVPEFRSKVAGRIRSQRFGFLNVEGSDISVGTQLLPFFGFAKDFVTVLIGRNSFHFAAHQDP